jgi:DNA invertase Pin-like site-specific DNA recombinase
MTGFYLRVSRDDLHCENQRRVLEEWAKRESIPKEKQIWLQEEVSTRKTRPEKEKLLQFYRDGKINQVVCAKMDRFARSLQELVMDIEGIINSNGRFVAVQNGLDFQKKTYNASQQLMLNIFASFAQFEREIIRERTLDGLARSKAQGKLGGKHPKDCGCGVQLKDGRVHNGTVKPLRNEKNQVIGWQWLGGRIKYKRGFNPPQETPNTPNPEQESNQPNAR